jgi:hypothetical protein
MLPSASLPRGRREAVLAEISKPSGRAKAGTVESVKAAEPIATLNKTRGDVFIGLWGEGSGWGGGGFWGAV